MGKITKALQKATQNRMGRIEKVSRIKAHDKMVVNKIKESNVDPSIIAYFDPKAVITEQYKTLRTNLLALNNGKGVKNFALTSSLHSEGKTVTSLNLAVSLSKEMHQPKILLVDADLRRGRIEKYLGIEDQDGLAEILSGKSKIEDVIFRLDNENLNIVTSGDVPDNPSELLSSQNMKNFMSYVNANFDFVLYDTPPIISVTDAGIIGAQTDGVIMVVQAGRTQRGIVKRAEELLHQSHTKILGHVLTSIEYHLPEYLYRYL